jgi:hypothetical protein
LNNKEFKDIVQNILAKHDIAILDRMWKQVISLEPQVDVIAYWIRDSNDVINIVWLTPLGIYDISWFPDPAQSAFNYVPLRNVLAFEVRKMKNVAQYVGHKVKGNVLVIAYCQPHSPNLLWIAETQKQTNELESFFLHVFTSYQSLTK